MTNGIDNEEVKAAIAKPTFARFDKNGKI